MCERAASVAGSSGSMPARTLSNAAASASVRAMGPAVSCVCEMGMMPLRLTSPTVGLIPASPLIDEGETIEPSVSVPTATAHKLAAAAAPDPELEPEGLRSSSLQLVLPRITVPAARRRATRNESFGGREPTSAMEPAVVCMRSAVAMLSFIKMGMPCSGPRGPFARRSRSRSSAIACASGLSSITEFTLWPL
jgi:hypothetical protein